MHIMILTEEEAEGHFVSVSVLALEQVPVQPPPYRRCFFFVAWNSGFKSEKNTITCNQQYLRFLISDFPKIQVKTQNIFELF